MDLIAGGLFGANFCSGQMRWNLDHPRLEHDRRGFDRRRSIWSHVLFTAAEVDLGVAQSRMEIRSQAVGILLWRPGGVPGGSFSPCSAQLKAARRSDSWIAFIAVWSKNESKVSLLQKAPGRPGANMGILSIELCLEIVSFGPPAQIWKS